MAVSKDIVTLKHTVQALWEHNDLHDLHWSHDHHDDKPIHKDDL